MGKTQRKTWEKRRVNQIFSHTLPNQILAQLPIIPPSQSMHFVTANALAGTAFGCRAELLQKEQKLASTLTQKQIIDTSNKY